MHDIIAEDVHVFSSPKESLVEMIAGKLHGLRITECRLDYHGSITIDTELLEVSHIIPLEFVYIWNKASGARISTYVLPGVRGTGVVCLNGAAARSCQLGDEIIVTSSRRIPCDALSRNGFTFSPRVVMFNHEKTVNNVAEILEYHTSIQDGVMHFSLLPINQ